jgi:hypothetical protein
MPLPPQAVKDAASILDGWKSQKNSTEQLMRLLQTYKDLGDSKSEVKQAARVFINALLGFDGFVNCDHRKCR